jgi:hypothetical protein
MLWNQICVWSVRRRRGRQQRAKDVADERGVEGDAGKVACDQRQQDQRRLIAWDGGDKARHLARLLPLGG